MGYLQVPYGFLPGSLFLCQQTLSPSLTLSRSNFYAPGSAHWGHVQRVGEEYCCHALQGLVVRVPHALDPCMKQILDGMPHGGAGGDEVKLLREHKNSGSRGHKVW